MILCKSRHYQTKDLLQFSTWTFIYIHTVNAAHLYTQKATLRIVSYANYTCMTANEYSLGNAIHNIRKACWCWVGENTGKVIPNGQNSVIKLWRFVLFELFNTSTQSLPAYCDSFLSQHECCCYYCLYIEMLSLGVYHVYVFPENPSYSGL